MTPSQDWPDEDEDEDEGSAGGIVMTPERRSELRAAWEAASAAARASVIRTQLARGYLDSDAMQVCQELIDELLLSQNIRACAYAIHKLSQGYRDALLMIAHKTTDDWAAGRARDALGDG